MPSVYEIITNKIIENLDKGVIPWRKPWKGGALGIPRRWNGTPYRGMNLITLGLDSEYKYPFWFGYKKITELGGKIKEKEFINHRISTYFKVSNRGTENEEIDLLGKKKFLLLYHKVWNLEQIDDLKIPEPLQILIKEQESIEEKKYDKKEECEKLINSYRDKPNITELEQRACYRPSIDEINMPKMGSFDSVDSYYATLFHELIHSTGHSKRLDRKGIQAGTFGDETYSQEELIAEFGASFLCGLSGIDQATLENSTAYIMNWKKQLQDNKQLVIQCAQAGSKAVDYMLGKERKY